MSYIVVLEEYADKHRHWSNYESYGNFVRTYHKSLGKIIDQGISEDTAKRLCGATEQMIENSRALSMPYHVVFEYTPKAGGYAGLRYYIRYHDQDQFVRMFNPKNERISILTQGISEDDAQTVVSLQPEISHLTAAVQEMCEGGRINIDIAAACLAQAADNIVNDRRHHKPITLIQDGIFRADFPFVEIGPKYSEKNRLFRFIKENLNNPYGLIGNLNLDILAIKMEIVNIHHDRVVVLF
jgi:hypothetical protein